MVSLPAGRHGVARVDGKVDDDLLELAGVDVDAGSGSSRSTVSSSTSSPMTRSSILRGVDDDALEGHDVGPMTCWRLNASSCRVRPAASSAALQICLTSSCRGSFSDRPSSSSSA